MVLLLLGHKTPRFAEMEREGVVPSFLAWPYARESAARAAAAMPVLSPVVLAALVRAAFLDEEEDVGAAARHTLILKDERVGDIMQLALKAVAALRHDECEFVRARALEFVELNPSEPHQSTGESKGENKG